MTGSLEIDAMTVRAAGHDRTMTVVRQETVRAGAAVVLVLHGSNQDGPGFRRFTGGAFDRLAGRDGAVVAYLDGYRKGWNDARLTGDLPARRDGVDDVAFVLAAADHLANLHPLDPARLYVAGFSLGGAMVIRLIHEIPDRLTGATIMSATQPVPENLMAFERPPAPLPVLLFHGTRDRLVPYGGGMASLWGFRPRGLGLSAPDTAAYFAARNGITAPPVTRPLTVAESPRGDRTRVERTDHEQDGRPGVTLYTVHGGGHTVPGPKRAPWIMGRTSRRLVAADVISDFFQLHPDPLSSR